MQLPKTLDEAYQIIRNQEAEIGRLREQEKDWINLAREYIDDTQKNWARVMIFRSKESERSLERSGDASRRPSD